MYPFSDHPSSYLLYVPRSYPPPPPPSLATPSFELPLPTAPSALWNQVGTQHARLRALAVDEDDDDEVSIDTSDMTQEEKNELKAQRKIKKTNKEKFKRSQVNDQFDHLCRILNVGKSTRVEKLTVLNETLRELHLLKTENRQLKEQTQQIRDLTIRAQNGEPAVSVLGGLPLAQDRMLSSPPPPAPSQACSRRLSTRGPPPPPPSPLLPLESRADFSQKEGFLFGYDAHTIVGPEMIPFGKDVLSSKEIPSEAPGASWNTMFADSQPNDLDFAFGDSGFSWTNSPRQDGVLPLPIESEFDFNPYSFPDPEHDNMDLFLTTSDDCDLLI